MNPAKLMGWCRSCISAVEVQETPAPPDGLHDGPVYRCASCGNPNIDLSSATSNGFVWSTFLASL